MAAKRPQQPESAMATSSLPKNDVRYWLTRLFKERRGSGYRDAGYSVRLAAGGRRERFQLGTASKYAAADKARAIYRSLATRGWGPTLAEFKAQGTPAAPPAPEPTIGAFLAELRALHASKVRTLDAYAGSLRRIAAEIAGLPPGGRGGSAEAHRLWREKVDALKLSILTAPAVARWREAFLARAGDDPRRQRSARVSVNTFLRESRSLFSPRHLEGLTSVVLPTPPPLAGLKLEKRTSARYQSGFDVLQLVKAASDELAEREPEMFKAFLLAVYAGLRRGEVDKLEWSQLNWQAGTVNVRATEFFKPKSEDGTRVVWLPAEALACFRGFAARATGRFVLESDVKPALGKRFDHYRASRTFAKLVAWLRGHGVEGEKPLHALRKEYGSIISQSYGLVAAKILLGHRDVSTTASHYLEVKGQPTVGLGHLLPPADNVVAFEPRKAAR
jgi:integrase